MKSFLRLLTLLALAAGTGHAATVFNFNTGTATTTTGDAFPTSVSIAYAYLETQDEFGDPLTTPVWTPDTSAPSPVTLGNPSTAGYGPAIDGLALDAVLSPVMFSFGSAVNLNSFGVTLDNSSLGTPFGTEVGFYDAGDVLLYSLLVDQTVSGFSVNQSLSLSGVSKVVLPSGAFYDNLSFGATAVPEPSRATFLGLTAACMVFRRRRSTSARSQA